MDKLATLAEHLAQAERHVAEGGHHIARQQEIVERLAADGHDITGAIDLLKTFEELQASHIADRDRIRAEIAQARDGAA